MPGSECSTDGAKTSFNQSVFNIAKMCMGSGTLGLPFGASQGGILFNVIGLFFITTYNIYSVERLIKSFGYIQQYKVRSFLSNDVERNRSNQGINATVQNTAGDGIDQPIVNHQDEPLSSGTFGKLAWYAFGSIGLHTIDAIMIILMFGIVIAYEGKLLM